MGKDQVPGHIVGLTSYCLMTHILFIPCQSALPFLKFQILTIWKSMVKVVDVVWSKVELQVGPASNQFTSFSFDINQTTHPWDTAISKFNK